MFVSLEEADGGGSVNASGEAEQVKVDGSAEQSTPSTVQE
jgi:hypothetical protein